MIKEGKKISVNQLHQKLIVKYILYIVYYWEELETAVKKIK